MLLVPAFFFAILGIVELESGGQVSDDVKQLKESFVEDGGKLVDKVTGKEVVVE